MNVETLDWAALERLRDGFLNGSAATGPYWQTTSDLANYDITFGERIGWKWDAVLRELLRRQWRPQSRTVLDWGCGSGIAGRRVIESFGASSFEVLHVWDHSSLARQFARTQAQSRFPGLAVKEFDAEADPVGLLVVSHVLNELSPAARAELRALCAKADAILWVEPGTSAVSEELVAWREDLRGNFTVIAPCPHQSTCGLLVPERATDWCHFFAEPPAEIHADSEWVRFGQRAGIDLRSLPYSFLVLARPPADPALPAGSSRILGRAEHFKGFARVLSCAQEAVEDLELQKRADPLLFKQLKRDPGIPLYRWRRTDKRIVGAETLFPDPPSASQ